MSGNDNGLAKLTGVLLIEEEARLVAKDEAAKRHAVKTAGAASQRLKVLSRAELDELPAQEFLIDQWLPARSLVYMWGKPSAGKSFVSIDMAACIRSGRAFHGYDVSAARVQESPSDGQATPRRVVYVMSEGLTGMPRRLRAWENVHHGGNAVEVEVVTGAPQMTSADHVAWLADVAEGAALIVIDTQARSTAGVEENSAKEMGPVIAAYAELIERTGCTVLVVHHGEDHMRGSKSMLGAADAVIAVENSGGIVTASMRLEAGGKVKDGQTPPDLQLVLTEDPIRRQDGRHSVALVQNAKAVSAAELGVLNFICTQVDEHHMPGAAISTTDLGTLTGRGKNVIRELTTLHDRFLVAKIPGARGAFSWRATDAGEAAFIKAGGSLPLPPAAPLPGQQAILDQLEADLS